MTNRNSFNKRETSFGFKNPRMATWRVSFSRHLSIILLGSMLSCGGVEGPPGQLGIQGPKGDKGDKGDPGNAHADCPIEYEQDKTAAGIILCKRGMDEVVKVGAKGSAFWIDRYEASVWDSEDGKGKQYGAMTDDYPSEFPKNGQVTKTLFALSKSGVTPSRYITWFQANEACAASGKRLPTNSEWQRAARGTQDPGSSGTGGASCLTQGAVGPRLTGQGTKCASDWGGQDMVGNLAEWIDDWMVGVGQLGSSSNKQPWPAQYGKDLTSNVVSATLPDGVIGLPSAVVRDASWGAGEAAGIFAYGVDSSPMRAVDAFGFRCVVPH